MDTITISVSRIGEKKAFAMTQIDINAAERQAIWNGLMHMLRYSYQNSSNPNERHAEINGVKYAIIEVVLNKASRHDAKLYAEIWANIMTFLQRRSQPLIPLPVT